MKNPLTVIVAILVALILLTYMVCFTVRYDQVAVVTTFNQAKEPLRDVETGEIARDAAGNIVDPGSVIYEPGFNLRWPWPISNVQTYSKKIQLIEDVKQEVKTSDGHAVIVQMYLAWEIDDPYAFFRSMNNISKATDQLKALMSSFQGIISNYRFDQLVNLDEGNIQLRKIEEKCADDLRAQLAGIKPSYGIKVDKVGIRRLVLPEDITAKVFERMRTTRERLAQTARAEGTATAETIKKEAESIQQQILAFAKRRASSIRDEGDREAASYYNEFAKDTEFAKFLRRMQALKEMLPNNTQFILSADDVGLNELKDQPILPQKPIASNE
ncbi:Modulator of FtsH protease HflC [Poriferisphaera corsica]|uniref:Protein HflC n=1 Tax=Poriferisphaera corsica TaxID=2528020 RepID=A0A517YYK2_9BACT|nr:protease modulator HflC [Poriferisphaera corsica]QDU35306.1 Modulator of FtsH protease HflC [Poriferisphaera corsica]